MSYFVPSPDLKHAASLLYFSIDRIQEDDQGDVLGRLLPTGHMLKIARTSAKRNWASAFHGASDPPNLQHAIPFEPFSTKGTRRSIHGPRRSTRESPISVTVVGITELITFTNAASTTLLVRQRYV